MSSKCVTIGDVALKIQFKFNVRPLGFALYLVDLCQVDLVSGAGRQFIGTTEQLRYAVQQVLDEPSPRRKCLCFWRLWAGALPMVPPAHGYEVRKPLGSPPVRSLAIDKGGDEDDDWQQQLQVESYDDMFGLQSEVGYSYTGSDFGTEEYHE